MWNHLNALAGTALAAGLSIAAGPANAPRPEQTDIEPLLQRARLALRADGQDGRGTVEVLGETQLKGLPASFRLTLGSDGRFLRQVDGRLSRTTGFDGEQAWRIDGASPPYPLVLLHRERALLTTCVWSGDWALEDSIVDVRPAGADGGASVELELREGLLHATLRLDADTGLPSRLTFSEEFGGGALIFEDWRKGRYGTFPWRIIWSEGAGEATVFRTSQIRAGVATSEFSAPRKPVTDTHFDLEWPSGLKVRRSGGGHLFVRPRINGEDVGWFLFDSGAGATIITKAAARTLKLPAFGQTAVGGFGGPPTMRPMRQSETVELGPLRIEGLALSETESMGMADRMLGEPCAGALGWDVFLRAVVVIDTAEPSVDLLDPPTYTNAEGHWEDVTLHWKVPYIRARFEGGREGLFCIDTGAGDTGVLFHSLATENLGLLEGRSATSLSGRGAGGQFKMRRVELAYFEVAGNRVAPAPALLSIGEDGEADPYAFGFLGNGFLGPRRLVFDYSRRRIGFLDR